MPLVALLCLFGLTAMANACCLPSKFVMDFTGVVGGKQNGVEARNEISGSLYGNFEDQTFTLKYGLNGSAITKNWLFDFGKGYYLFTQQRSQQPGVCHMFPLKGNIGKNYRCFIGYKSIADHSTITKSAFMIRFGKYAKLLGMMFETADSCLLKGMQRLAVATIPGSEFNVAYITDMRKVHENIKSSVQCAEKRVDTENGLQFPSLKHLVKMSGKGVASLFSKLTQIETAEPEMPKTTTALPEVTGSGSGAEVTGGDNTGGDDNGDGSITESGSGKGSGEKSDEDDTDNDDDDTTDGSVIEATSIENVDNGSGTGSGGNGDNDDSEGGDDTEVGSVENGSGNGSGDKNENDDDDGSDDDNDDGTTVAHEENPDPWTDVDGDGVYDENDEDYWEYYYHDEDAAIEEWEEEQDRLRAQKPT